MFINATEARARRATVRASYARTKQVQDLRLGCKALFHLLPDQAWISTRPASCRGYEKVQILGHEFIQGAHSLHV